MAKERVETEPLFADADAAGLKGEAIEMKYAELSSLRKWDRNPKNHQLRFLIEVFIKHGFWDPVKWDSKLNKGKGGIKAGNGRFAALTYMKENDFSPPRGILVRETDGEWLIPVTMGVDANSLLEAEVAGFEHNAATLRGSNLNEKEQMSIWNLEELRPVLRDATEPSQLPLMLQEMEGEKLRKLLGEDELILEGEKPGKPAPEVKQPKGVPSHVRTFQMFLNRETYVEFQEAVARLKTVYEANGEKLVATDVVFRAVLAEAARLAPLPEPEEEEPAPPAYRGVPGDFVAIPPSGELCLSCTSAVGAIITSGEMLSRNKELKAACTCNYRLAFRMLSEEDFGDEDNNGAAPY